MHKKTRYPRIFLVISGAIIAAGVWFAAPAFRSKADWYSAYSTLKLFDQAEARYRSGDLDRNGVPDFWTGDVAGLYQYGLISREIAEADAAPLRPLVPKPVPYKGYLFMAMEGDDNDSPPVNYRQETDKTSGKVHNLYSFGFCAFTADGMESSSGDHFKVGFINENGTTFWGGPATTAPLRRIPRNFRAGAWAPE